MSVSRRSFCTSLLATSALAALPRYAIAEMSLGSARLRTVSDGHLTLPRDFIFGSVPEAALAEALQGIALPEGPLQPDCNLTLYQDGSHTVLFDTGSGADFMPTAGKLVDSLAALDLAPEDITHVIFTHAHPDHIWGAIDDFDEPLFANATHLIGRQEWDYWWDPQTVETIGAERAAFAVGAKRRLELIEDRIERFESGDELLAGIAAFATPGHTPGHMSFELRNGSQSVLVGGDAIGNHHIAFRRPAWLSGSDQDQEQAADTRSLLFDRLTHEDMALVGFHLPHGGMGRVERDGDAYRFVAQEG